MYTICYTQNYDSSLNKSNPGTNPSAIEPGTILFNEATKKWDHLFIGTAIDNRKIDGHRGNQLMVRVLKAF